MNIPTQERKDLLAELSDALNTEKVRTSFWACLQVCDIDQLRDLIRQAKAAPILVAILIENCNSVPRTWKQQPPKAPTEASSVSSSASEPTRASRGSRARGPRKETCQRDGHACALTKIRIYEVAHIYPHCLINPARPPNEYANSIPDIWKLLQVFWKPEQVQLWQQEIFRDPNNPTKASDACFNVICLQPNIHKAWSMGLFALRPLEYNHDKSKLEVEWYWQPKQSHGPDDLVELKKIPPSSRDLDEVDGFNVILKSSPNNFIKIKSGHKFTLETPDPQRLPLPSKELLELQWHLNRIVSMSAAGEGSEEDYDDDADDDSVLLQDECREGVEDWIDQVPPPPSHSPTPSSELGSDDESDDFATPL